MKRSLETWRAVGLVNYLGDLEAHQRGSQQGGQKLESYHVYDMEQTVCLSFPA